MWIATLDKRKIWSNVFKLNRKNISNFAFNIQVNYQYVQGLDTFMSLNIAHSTFLKKALDDVLYQNKDISQEMNLENVSSTEIETAVLRIWWRVIPRQDLYSRHGVLIVEIGKFLEIFLSEDKIYIMADAYWYKKSNITSK